MTITLWPVVWPILATILAILVAGLWPIHSSGGDYNFGGAMEAGVHLVLAVIVVLIIWLIFFIVT